MRNIGITCAVIVSLAAAAPRAFGQPAPSTPPPAGAGTAGQEQPALPQPRPAAEQPATEPTPTRPATGLFRGVQPPPRDVVALTSSLYGGWDQELRNQGEESGPNIRGLDAGGPFSGLDLGLDFTPSQDGKVSFNATGFTSFRYYRELQDLVAASQTGSGAVSIRLSRKFTLQGRGGFGYTPQFDFTTVPDADPLAGTGAPATIPNNAFARKVRTFDGDVDLTHTPNERTSLTVRYAARSTDVLGDLQHSTDRTTSASFSRRVGRRTGASITFVNRQGEYHIGEFSRPVSVNDLEVEIERDFARSPTRHTSISFLVGPSVVDHQSQRLIRAFGGASITHPFGRSWDLRAAYRRGVNFLNGLPDPVFSDSMTVNLGGLMTRKLDFSLSAGIVLGELGVDVIASQYDLYTASMRGRYAFTQSLAIYSEALYNYHKFSDPIAALQGQDRSGVRVGMTWYLPLVQERVRPTPASARPRPRR